VLGLVPGVRGSISVLGRPPRAARREALEREVNNGGYSQFFTNSSKEFAPRVAEALEVIFRVDGEKLVAGDALGLTPLVFLLAGLFIVNPNEGRVLQFIEKAEGEPPTNRINAGAYVIEREIPGAKLVALEGAVEPDEGDLEDVGGEALDAGVHGLALAGLADAEVARQQLGDLAAPAEQRLGVAPLPRFGHRPLHVVLHRRERLEVGGEDEGRRLAAFLA
jgi:hypothetical protein